MLTTGSIHGGDCAPGREDGINFSLLSILRKIICTPSLRFRLGCFPTIGDPWDKGEARHIYCDAHLSAVSQGDGDLWYGFHDSSPLTERNPDAILFMEMSGAVQGRQERTKGVCPIMEYKVSTGL